MVSYVIRYGRNFYLMQTFAESQVWGRTRGSGPPTPPGSNPLPRPFFIPHTPAPIFSFFSGTPAQNSDFLPPPRPSDPRPFLVKSPPTPAPLTLGPRPPVLSHTRNSRRSRPGRRSVTNRSQGIMCQSGVGRKCITAVGPWLWFWGPGLCR